jgi:hypothetical protein
MSQAADEIDVCLPSDLDFTSSAQTCAGPWTYKAYDKETSAFNLCACQTHKTCSRDVEQPDYHNNSKTVTIPGVGCHWEDTVPPVWTCNPNPIAAHTACQTWLLQDSTPGPVGPVHFIDDVDSPVDQVATGWGVTEALLTNTFPATQHVFRCNATVEWFKRFVGPHPDCGCQVHQSCLHAKRTERPSKDYDTFVETAKLVKEVVTPAAKTKQWVRDNHVATMTTMGLSVLGQITPAKIAPICSTAEDVASGDFPGKLKRLLESLRNPLILAKGASVVNEIVSRGKVAYEFFNNAHITSYAHDPEPGDPQPPLEEVIEELYEAYPTVEHACGRHADAVATPCDAATNWRLRFCTRLTSAHVGVVYNASSGALTSGDLVARLYKECIQELDSLADAVESGACAVDDPFVTASLDVHRRLQDKLLLRFGVKFAPQTTPADDSPPSEITALQPMSEVLHDIDRWYAQTTRLMPEPEPLRAELTLATNKFWQAAQGFKVGGQEVEWVPNSLYKALSAIDTNPPPPLATLEAALGTAEKRGFRLDRAVINAAYSNIGASEPVMVGAPLLRITAQALAPLAERLDALVQFHDVGCSLIDCTALATPTQVPQFWKVLAHLTAGPGSNPDLGQVLGTVTTTLSNWKPAFQKIKDFQPRFLDAAANGQSEVNFLALLQQARDRIASYEATGVFEPAVSNLLYKGINTEQRAGVRDHLDGPGGLNEQLTATLDDIEDRIELLVQGLVRVVDNSTSQAQAEAALEGLRLELMDLRAREGAFSQIALDGAEAVAFETLMQEWSTVDDIVDQQGQLILGSSATYFLSGGDARFDGNWNDENIANVAPVGFQKIELDANQVLSVAIASNSVWSPTCALRDVHMATLAEGEWQAGPQLDIAGALAGPEGFTVGWSGSNFYADGFAEHDVDRITSGWKVEGCAGAGLDLGPVAGSGQACAYYDNSHTDEFIDTWQNGSESRSTVQLLGGLYVPGVTPYEAPAGALVVVEMPRGVTTPAQYRTAHFVRAPHTSIVVKEDADLYLVVNDLICPGQDTASKLEVTVNRLETVGTAAEAMVKRMACTLALVHDRIQPFIERGEVLSAEIEELELQAKFDMVIGAPGFACDAGAGTPPIGFDQYPQPLKDMYLKYLAREMKRLEAEVRLVDIRREIVIRTAAEIAALETVRNTQLSGYLLALSPEWTARGMRLRELRDIVNKYSADIRQHLRPLIQLWYPGVMVGADAQPLRAAAGDLANVAVDTGEIEMANNMRELGHLLALRIAEAELPYPTPQETAPSFVALRFPRPDLLDPACAQNPAARCRRAGQSAGYRWATVAQTRTLWEDQLGLQSGDPATNRRLVFELSPDDLYQQLAGSAYLSCTKSLPVVRKIGVGATGFCATCLPSDPRDSDAFLPEPALMEFPGVAGVSGFQMVNPTWLHFSTVPFVFGTGDYNKLKTDFLAVEQDVRGVSPFTRFVFEIPEALIQDWNLRAAATIDVLLELEATRSTATVGIPACSAATP